VQRRPDAAGRKTNEDAHRARWKDLRRRALDEAQTRDESERSDKNCASVHGRFSEQAIGPTEWAIWTRRLIPMLRHTGNQQ